MAKLRTAALLLARLDAELAWRKHDIAALTAALDAAKGKARETLVRALVAITYAHWEGFTKAAIISYAQHISLQGKSYGLLIRSLSGLRAVESVQTLGVIKRKLFTASKVLDEIHAIEQESAILSLDARIGKIGNLNYELFSELMDFFGIDTAPYASKSALIDESLLRRRNTIAHGDYIELSEVEARMLTTEVLSLLSSVKDDLAGAAVTKSYLRPAA